ncbi:hypothetical protein C8R43DRAFT_1154625 [Mycena crocata]|nr:hypothetical protein C8R43DRAFT_1154625 [Mycena crocata]
MPHGAGRMECSAARPRVTFRIKNPPQWNSAAARVFDVGTTNDAYSLNERDNQTVRPNINREAEVRRVLATAQHEENGALSRILHLWVTMDQSHNGAGGKEMRFKIVDTKATNTIFIGETHQSPCAVASLVVRFTKRVVHSTEFSRNEGNENSRSQRVMSLSLFQGPTNAFLLVDTESCLLARSSPGLKLHHLRINVNCWLVLFRRRVQTLGAKAEEPGLQVPPTHVDQGSQWVFVHKINKVGDLRSKKVQKTTKLRNHADQCGAQVGENMLCLRHTGRK